MFIKLKSVASVFNTKTKMVYPSYQNGGYDKDAGVHIYECSDDFVNSLSDDDVISINEPPISKMEDLESYGRGRSKY